MKKHLRILMSLCIPGILIMPVVTLAAGDTQDCNRYGAKCHVSGVQTYHTDDEDVSAGLLDTVKNAINWCLGIMATVVLCFCMYGGFKMLTSGTDSKGYDAGWKVLKNALLGLAIVLLAWMIVSVVFWFVATLSGGNQTQSAPVE